jgi:hypothetical protein
VKAAATNRPPTTPPTMAGTLALWSVLVLIGLGNGGEGLVLIGLGDGDEEIVLIWIGDGGEEIVLIRIGDGGEGLVLIGLGDGGEGLVLIGLGDGDPESLQYCHKKTGHKFKCINPRN